MEITEEHVVPLSRRKLVTMVLVSCACAVASLWLVLMDDATIESYHRFNNPMLVHGIGIAGVIFTAVCIIFGITKMFDTSPGLLLNSSGIRGNSGAISFGLVPWSDVTGFGVFEIHGQRMLIVEVVDPSKYIESGNVLKRAINRGNIGLVNSPVYVTPTSLAIDFDELLELCNEYFLKYGKGRPDSNQKP